MNLASKHVFFAVAGALLGASEVGAINATRALLGVTRVVSFGLGNIVPTRAAHHFHEAGVAALTRYLGLAFAYGLVTQFAAIGVVAGFIVTTVIRNSTLAISLFRQLNDVRGAMSLGHRTPISTG